VVVRAFFIAMSILPRKAPSILTKAFRLASASVTAMSIGTSMLSASALAASIAAQDCPSRVEVSKAGPVDKGISTTATPASATAMSSSTELPLTPIAPIWLSSASKIGKPPPKLMGIVPKYGLCESQCQCCHGNCRPFGQTL